MAKGKSQYAVWVCEETGAQTKVFAYNKRQAGDTYAKETMLYSPKLRKHTKHKRKDLKKPVQK